MDHVLFDYLSLVAVPVAQALVAYVLSGSSSPPNASSAGELFAAVQAAEVPSMEVALWGGMSFGDIDFARSGLSSPPNSSSTPSSFFGSVAGDAFRAWALTPSSASPALSRIEWVDSAEDAAVAGDTNVGGNAAFEKVWSAPGGSASRAWAQLKSAGVVG
ncbi:hypothetical protein JCM10213_005055 [Rhodosporidiobolus nylandii]